MKTLIEGLKQFQITLTESQQRQLRQYYDLLVKANQVLNLTASTAWEEVLIKHYLDSLSIAAVMDLNQVKSVIDVGTGAGFPGMVLKIAFPHLQITLLDSLNKRVRFLNDVIQALQLEGITAIHGRAEETGRMPEHREQYDLCVSRAVANLSTLAEYCMPFVKVDGIFCAYKGSGGMEELKGAERAISMLSGALVSADQLLLPNSDITRVLIRIQKEKPVSGKYPRRAGLPAKEPLV